MKSKRKKKPKVPKARHTWEINPKTRLKPSGKIYRRSSQKKKPGWVDLVDWFGGEP